MRRHYDHARVQEYWQHVWEREDVYSCPDDADDPTYVLGMFPYTSGSLHMGHVRNYAITDAYARFRRMQGDTVLHPMGWDAFGLPAENAAHERLTDPESWTRSCIERMRDDMEELGFGYDWDREITTCDPEYYQWNQWLFTQFHEAGLVDYRDATVNWCPDCETVLADAQVETGDESSFADAGSESLEDPLDPAAPGGEQREDGGDEEWDSEAIGDDDGDHDAHEDGGVCWRCGTPVVTRDLEQWFLRTTEYAAELEEGLDDLDAWPEGVRNIQADWIGRQEGAEVSFDVPEYGSLSVFSARLDTIHGASYVAVSPGHDLARDRAGDDPEFADALDALHTGDHADATAGLATGLTATHPLTGASLPIYVAPYVLEDVGTGALMGVPAHDERDHAFATAHDLPIESVIEPAEDAEPSAGDVAAPFTDDGVLSEAAGEYAGLESADARERFLEDLGAAEAATTYRLRDWLISRQRYWGTPIPIVHCEDCGRVPVPEEDLPIELPEFEHTTGNPLDDATDWKRTECPDCGGPAERETDTMDTFVDSSWYFLRYLSPDLDDAPFDADLAEDWLPVDVYVGGEEHAVLHLLYIRFFARALADLDLATHREPVERLVNQGTVLHSGRQMSEASDNVVAPHEYGPETTRLFVLSAAHPERDFEWTARNVGASYDLQQDCHGLVVDFLQRTDVRREREPRDDHLDRAVDRAIETVADHYESFRFHRAVTEIRELAGLCSRYSAYGVPHDDSYRRALKALAALIAPLTPYLGEELWNLLRADGLVVEADWPETSTDVPTADRAAERRLVDDALADVREIVDVVDIDDPEHVELVVAQDWKYRAYEIARGAGRDEPIVGNIRGDEAVPDTDAAAAFAGDLASEGQGLEPVVDGERALELLADAAWLLDDEFGANVTVRQAEDGDGLAEKATPRKPAIHVE
ncbi:leucine--tRNA ligase [Salinarchaeum chitinilyticum]